MALLLILMIFCSNSLSQVIEKNGIYFTNHEFNPATLRRNSDNRTEFQKAFSSEKRNNDTIQTSFIKQDFIVNSLDGNYGSNQTSVSCAMDGNGNYAFTWLDFRNGEKQIYTQFNNNKDKKIGSNFKVNEFPLNGNNSPFIASNKKGDFVIVWLQDFSIVFAQRFSKEGKEVGGIISVNTIGALNTMEPSVAVNEDGSFMVMWASQQWNSIYQTYARLFDKFGNPLSFEIPINEQGLNISSIGQGKHISIDGNGNYCITWSSYGTGNFSNIYLQMINGNGEKIGSNKLVSSLSDSSNKFFPQVVSTDDGHFLIAWQRMFNDLSAGNGVGARIYFSDNFVSDVFLVSKERNTWNSPNIASDKDSTFLVFFLENGFQYLRKIKSTGEFIGDTVRVRYNSPKSINSFTSGLTNIYSNHFFIASQVYERNDANIYLQKFNTELKPVGPYNKIHDDYGSAWQRKPIVKFNNKGESIVLWEDSRNGRSDLFAQVYDENFNPRGNNIQINVTNAEHWFLYDKVVKCLSDGTFVIAYSGSDEYNAPAIFLKLVDPSNEKIGKKKLVKEKSYYDNYKIALNINSQDKVLVCWHNRYGAYFKKFNNNLSQSFSENNFIKYKQPVVYNEFAISIDTSFNIFAAWTEYNFETNTFDNKIKGRFFSEDGSESSEIFIIDSSNSNISNLMCKNENKSYAVLYQDYYTIHLKRKYDFNKEYTFQNIFYNGFTGSQLNIEAFNSQKIFITYNSGSEVLGFFANDNQRKTKLFRLHTYEYINPYSDYFNGSNSTDLFEGKLIFTFESSKNGGTGYDIWSNVRKIENVNFEDEVFFEPVNYDILYQNYPNPFNPKTKIVYELYSYHKVRLAVYDILGREIKVLVNEYQEKGLYQVEFDASNLASGIYFYKLDAFNTSVKKMLLIR